MIRTYDFTIKREKKAPDGYLKNVLVINGQFPGPLIEANWGDTIQVTVHNEITGPPEGVALHWHGILQKTSQSVHSSVRKTALVLIEFSDGWTECPGYNNARFPQEAVLPTDSSLISMVPPGTILIILPSMYFFTFLFFPHALSCLLNLESNVS